jgi:hypothetical protein
VTGACRLSRIQFSPLVSGADDLGELDVVHDNGCLYVRAPLAASNDGKYLTFVDVGLRPEFDRILEGYQPFDFHAFGYEITLVPQAGGPIQSTMDRQLAVHWLPGSFANVVLEVAAACCRTLLEMVEPQYIYRVTFRQTDHERLLRKHRYMTQVIESSGYSVLAIGTDPGARMFWLMGKSGVDLPPREEENPFGSLL